VIHFKVTALYKEWCGHNRNESRQSEKPQGQEFPATPTPVMFREDPMSKRDRPQGVVAQDSAA